MNVAGRLRRPDRSRAQTGIDFMVGMGVFLLAVGFVFGFAPGLFEPFTSGSGSSMVVADRGAATLAEDLLVDSVDRPGILNATCTVEFFDGDGTTGDCRFDTEDLHEAMGIGDVRQLNVTIEDGGAVVSLTAGGDSATLAAGPVPDPNRDGIVASRLVHVDGTDWTLVVRVW